ncbi:hypothetical protein Desaci_2374 [Desulfosporosinus acidiphilus SJ4]|uniref:Uncharacterized protein n=1 Tax=Desulfosporosinus acidiphilus (strain DSM 22704 / JCM 16185 / SJ4) TaxID=646529 RepID=I4D6A3_DESAJ|nr:hypothetical protein [Desulfosporosinus acidiphilus]AFM41327.1 hypothetical protein Desaci_2374 [Desulfosporosinus acidiphilus SJ4]
MPKLSKVLWSIAIFGVVITMAAFTFGIILIGVIMVGAIGILRLYWRRKYSGLFHKPSKHFSTGEVIDITPEYRSDNLRLKP